MILSKSGQDPMCLLKTSNKAKQLVLVKERRRKVDIQNGARNDSIQS